MKKLYRYAIAVFVIALLGYNSVYFKKWSEVKNTKQEEVNFNVFADSLYYGGILKSNKAVDLPTLLAEIQKDSEAAFATYGNVLGIGNSAYFMVKTFGQITDLTETGITLKTAEGLTLTLDTKYIFGNGLRDASGLVKLTDFKTTADFNKVSEALNTIVREKALPPVVQKLKKGDSISATGALKLSKKHLKNTSYILIPAQITLL